MRETLSFRELLRSYPLEGRTLIAFVEKGDAVTLRFDLYHCDDSRRCKEGMKYLFDVSSCRENIRILGGREHCMHGSFSADILTSKITDGELRLVADCSYYEPKERDLITIVFSGDEVRIKEHLPNQIG